MPTSPPRRERPPPLVLLAILLLAGMAGNYFAVSLFFGVDLLLGSVATMLVLRLYGVLAGTISAALVSSYTYVLWNHPWAAVIFTAEALGVGLLVWRRRAPLVLADALYWVVAGVPLVFLFYSGVMEMAATGVAVVALKQAVNALLNALLASLILHHTPLRRFDRSQSGGIPLQQTLFGLLAAAMILPPLCLMVLDGRSQVQRVERELAARTEVAATAIGTHLTAWARTRLHAVEQLAAIAAEIGPGRVDELQRQTTLVHRLHPSFVNVYVADRDGNAIAFDPAVNERGERTVGLNFSDRPYFEAVRRTGRSHLSNVFLGRGGTYKPIVTFSAPVLVDGEFQGFALGALDLDGLARVLERHGAQGVEVTLVDRAGKVIVSTVPGLVPLTAHAEHRGGETVDLGPGTYRWMPPARPGTPIMSRWRQSMFGHARRVEEPGWTLFVEAPLAPEQRRLEGRYVRSFGVTLGLALLSLLLASALARWMTRPLARLAELSTDLPARLETTGPVTWPSSSVREVESLARNFERMTAALKERLAERARTERAFRLLADASSGLVETLEAEAMLRHLVRAAVPALGDGCVAAAVTPDGAPTVIAAAHVSEARAEALRALDARLLLAGAGDGAELEALTPATVPAPLAPLVAGAALRIPLHARGRRLGVLLLLRDEADATWNDCRTLAEELGRRAALALDNARLYRELEHADRAKDDFLAMLAHELRNPLAPISAALALLDRPEAAGERPRKVLDRQIKHLQRLVDDLLDVARITRGKVELRKQVVDLALLVEESAETIGPMVAAARQTLTVEVRARPAPADVDPTRIRQVLQNLLHNASKYTPPGGRIWIELRREGSEAVITVRDDGIGMGPELVPRVFDLFMQGNPSLDRAHGGLGLGLTLVRRLVEMHGGKVSATSDGPGKGSAFTVRLACVAAAAVSPPQAARNGASHATHRHRVLIVDDNVDAADTLAELLRDMGHEVLVSYDGPSSLDRARQFDPSLVLLDIGLPGMDGFEVARRLRADPRLQRSKLVALTGYGQASDRQRAQEAGFDVHFTKPVDFAALERLLQQP